MINLMIRIKKILRKKRKMEQQIMKATQFADIDDNCNGICKRK